ncbi:hypothetical protein K7X08_021267 [Anisodus acutangulus]|uniref:Ribosome maturation factor RimP N-terminal domain-containing protein n=1 Tax=Anisodus acutangulus TaxID=402998 RepID=A0A9Q1RBA3_9SOLA|nr:hypothetical protein K7X08_021267 [Anisodus acutangulus]
MMRIKFSSKINFLLRNPLVSTPLCHHGHRFPTILQPKQPLQNGGVPSRIHISALPLRYSSEQITPDRNGNDPLHYETIEDVEPIDLWEEEEEDVEPEIGDGGDGGGIVLQSCPWGEQALSIARDVLLPFGADMELYAFKTSPRGYIYVRLDKLPNEYGCPIMDEMEEFSRQYKKKLDEAGALGKIPDDLALEVSSPGAERLLKVPDDLSRFKDMPMRVSYIEELNSRNIEKNGIFFMESIDAESGSCVWKLADVKENRDPAAKGRPLSRKQKDWRLRLPYATVKRVTLYLDY